MTIKDFYCTTFLNFVAKYSPELIERARRLSNNPRQLIRTHIYKHLEYGTITPCYIDGELVGLCNYDVTDVTAHIKNCVVHPDYRGKNILQKLAIRGISQWPFVTHIEFERGFKNNKKSRTYKISDLLKINKEHHNGRITLNTSSTSTATILRTAS